MFIRIYRTESNLQFIMLIISTLLLWLPALTHPLDSPPSHSPLPFYTFILSLTGNQGIVNTILAMLLVMAEGILLTLLLSRHELFPRNNALPALVFVLLMSWHPDLLCLHPVILQNLLMLAFLLLFLNLYEKPDPFKEVFGSSVCLSLASFLDITTLVFLLLTWLGFMIYRLFSWRIWIINLLGFSLPWLYLFVYYFWYDNWIQVAGMFYTSFLSFEWINTSIPVITWIALVILGFFCLSATLSVAAMMQERVISIRKKFLFMIWYLLLSIPVFLFSGDQRWIQGSVSMIPATAILSYFFVRLKRVFWWEVIFTLLVCYIIWIRIFPAI